MWNWGSDSVIDSSVLSYPAGAQNFSCQGIFDSYICPKSYAKYELGAFNP